MKVWNVSKAKEIMRTQEIIKLTKILLTFSNRDENNPIEAIIKVRSRAINSFRNIVYMRSYTIKEIPSIKIT